MNGVIFGNKIKEIHMDEVPDDLKPDTVDTMMVRRGWHRVARKRRGSPLWGKQGKVMTEAKAQRWLETRKKLVQVMADSIKDELKKTSFARKIFNVKETG